MLIFICASVLAAASALPAPQILTPAAALTTIPSTNHILILTPQAQVQLEPSIKYSQPIVQHLTPVARIDSPTDQTVVYYPNENLINSAYQKTELKPKQLETANLTNIVNQFVSAGQTAQAQLEAFQQQLTQGLETLIQPSGQKIEEGKDPNLKEPFESASVANKLIESARYESGRYYSVPGAPQFYSNFELIHSPVNPLYAVHPYRSVRATLPLTDEKPENAALVASENVSETKVQREAADIQLAAQKDITARSTEAVKAPEGQSHPESLKIHNKSVQKEVVADNSHLGKYLGSLENNGVFLDNPVESKKEEGIIENSRKNKDEKDSELGSFAEALPSGLAISGEGGLSQAKPVGSAIVGKNGVAFSAPSGTAISGSSNQ